jgi:hypothetical protein
MIFRLRSDEDLWIRRYKDTGYQEGFHNFFRKSLVIDYDNVKAVCAELRIHGLFKILYYDVSVKSICHSPIVSPHTYV